MSSRARWAESHLQHRFENQDLLELALTHRSASKHNNERLEFLGDALLNFTVARRLYDLRPEDSEGDLSRARAALVNQSTLAAIGREIGIDRQLVLGRGELRSGGAQRAAVLADALEAVIGAVLLDAGHAAAERLVDRLFADRLERLPESADLKDPKTRLQEWLQGRGLPLPVYRVDSVQGREHEQIFTVVCTVGERDAQTVGRGRSRRFAEQQAAAVMLAELARERE
ncbi:MAG TPA: ribonuclease III [Gammaproteobacteria bacterium]